MSDLVTNETRARALQLFRAGHDEQIEHSRAAAESLFTHFADRCESPIEELMLAALAFGLTEIDPVQAMILPTFCSDKRESELVVEPQRKIGPYRIDFAVLYTCVEGTISGPTARMDVKIAVECDGHDFHEKTREQAERDKARDRFLLTEGWAVLRFTGREIVRDPRACAAAVALFLREESHRQWLLQDRAA